MLFNDIYATVYEAPYDQWELQLNNPRSEVFQNNHEFLLIILSSAQLFFYNNNINEFSDKKGVNYVFQENV